MVTGPGNAIAIREEESSPEAPRPLVIRKKPSLVSGLGSNRLSMGLDAFQLKQAAESGSVEKQEMVERRRPFQPNVMIKTADDDQTDWEEIENSRQMLWNRFCNEAAHELQKRSVNASLELSDSE
jgi:hypothetical protein